MYPNRPPLLLLCVSTILLSLTAMQETTHAYNDIVQETTSEKAPTDNETADLNTIPLYYISKLDFDGNKHFNQRKLRDSICVADKKSVFS